MKTTRILAIALTAILAIALTGCATTFAEFAKSPATTRLLNVAAQAAATSLAERTGRSLPPEARDALRAAITPVIETAGASALLAIGDALRSKQSAKAPVLSEPVVMAVETLVGSGVPQSAANEAVAVALEAAANTQAQDVLFPSPSK